MKIRRVVFSLLIVLLARVNVSTAQDVSRRTASATMPPCPGGTASMEVHPTSVPGTLDELVYGSELIVVGTVADVLPAFNVNPEDLISIETHSRVTVQELLYGALPSPILTILLVQMGGQAGPCNLVVPADPLIQKGEQYVLFLRADEPNRVPDISGLPRYFVLGVWSGKAKVENGKIQFLPSASPALHEYDNMDAIAFIAVVENRIRLLRRLQ